jgi:hypothetical protein
MTQINDRFKNVDKLVVTFDICSSTAILEDLILSDNLNNYIKLLIELKKFLMVESNKMDFDVYKFIGDGWILIFNEDLTDNLFAKFLFDLCKIYHTLTRKYLKPVINVTPNNMGLSFGIDKGTLVEIVMNGRKEYIGRAINIACRLQSAIGQKDKHPYNKVLISKHAFSYLLKENKNDFSQFQPNRVRRTLKNIQDNKNLECVKLSIKLKI